MTPDEMIAVITAHQHGKTIQFSHKDHDTWATCASNGPAWNFHEFDYRVEPEPKPDKLHRYCVKPTVSDPTIRRVEHWERPNLILTFDGETGALKSAEVLR